MKALQVVSNRPGVARAVLYITDLLIHYLTDSWFVNISLRRRDAPMVRNGVYSHKIDYITLVRIF